jgi:hypothetical protein
MKTRGLDHTKLTYKYNGRNFRLTDVARSSEAAASISPLVQVIYICPGCREEPP